MRSNQYVAGWPLQKTVGLKRAAVRWYVSVAFAAGGANYHSARDFLAVSAGALQIVIVVQGALEMFWF